MIAVAAQALTALAGELDADAVAQVLTRLLPDLTSTPSKRTRLTLLPAASAPPVPCRSPGYCSGCPHNRSTVLPDGALAGGGVGCQGIMYFEVARLHLAFDCDAAARHLGIEGRYTLKYHLHPPALCRLGLRHKLPMGKPYALTFQVLARMKRLRGTPLDVFGWDPDRRLERTLIGEYEQLIEGAGDLPYDDAVRLAQSVQSVKGYAQVKEAAVTRWRSAVAALLDHAPDPVRAGNPQGSRLRRQCHAQGHHGRAVPPGFR
jgi:hypothetical protein